MALRATNCSEFLATLDLEALEQVIAAARAASAADDDRAVTLADHLSLARDPHFCNVRMTLSYMTDMVNYARAVRTETLNPTGDTP